MALTPEQLAAREGKLTASRVACLMRGDKEEILNLWKEMVGDPSFVPEDLTWEWPVRLGALTEALNLDWYEYKKGIKLERRGLVVVHPDYDWAAATLDGFDGALPGPVETKHVNGWTKTEEVIQRYMPQLHWQMECTQSKFAAISIIAGAGEPDISIIPYNKEYADELMSRAHRFMRHVWELTLPVEMPPVASPVLQSQLRVYNMTGNNQYAANARDWLQHKDAAKKFDAAAKGLKEGYPADASRLTGYGVDVVRDKAGRLTVKPSS